MRLTPGVAFGWTFHISNLRKGEVLKHAIDTSATLSQMAKNEFILILSGNLIPVYEEGSSKKLLPYDCLYPGNAPYNDFPQCTTVWESGEYTLHQAESEHQGFCVSRLQNNNQMPVLEKVILAAGETLAVCDKLLFLISGELITPNNQTLSQFTEVDVKSNVTLRATTDCIAVYFSDRKES
jgi:hypothetical protein